MHCRFLRFSTSPFAATSFREVLESRTISNSSEFESFLLSMGIEALESTTNYFPLVSSLMALEDTKSAESRRTWRCYHPSPTLRWEPIALLPTCLLGHGLQILEQRNCVHEDAIIETPPAMVVSFP